MFLLRWRWGSASGRPSADGALRSAAEVRPDLRPPTALRLLLQAVLLFDDDAEIRPFPVRLDPPGALFLPRRGRATPVPAHQEPHQRLAASGADAA